MTEENLNETKECNCVFCRMIKSDCFKKFLSMLLASFIGCSLAILLFAPKPPKMPFPGFMPKCPMMQRQLPPPNMHHRDFRGEFRGDFKKHKPCPVGEFKHRRDFKDMPPMEHRNFNHERPVNNIPQEENVAE